MQIQRFDRWLIPQGTRCVIAVILLVGASGALMFFHIARPKLMSLHEWAGMAFLGAALLHGLKQRRALTIALRQGMTRWMILLALLFALPFLLQPRTQRENLPRVAVQAMFSAPLDQVCSMLGLSPELAALRLRQAGVIDPRPTMSIRALAKASNLEPSRLMAALSGDKSAD